MLRGLNLKPKLGPRLNYLVIVLWKADFLNLQIEFWQRLCFNHTTIAKSSHIGFNFIFL